MVDDSLVEASMWFKKQDKSRQEAVINLLSGMVRELQAIQHELKTIKYEQAKQSKQSMDVIEGVHKQMFELAMVSLKSLTTPAPLVENQKTFNPFEEMPLGSNDGYSTDELGLGSTYQEQ